MGGLAVADSITINRTPDICVDCGGTLRNAGDWIVCPTCDWCDVDDCPTAICKGPHIEHRCGEYVYTLRADQECPTCGEKP